MVVEQFYYGHRSTKKVDVDVFFDLISVYPEFLELNVLLFGSHKYVIDSFVIQHLVKVHHACEEQCLSEK